MRHSFSLALLYTLVASLWVFGSDQLVFWLHLNSEATMHLQMAKGLIFVIASSLALFFLLRQLDAEKQLATQLKSPPRDVSLPLVLLLLFALLTVIPGLLASREALRYFGDTAVNVRLLIWFGFVLVFALFASAACILFWWRSTKASFLLDRLRIDFERAKLRHRYEALLSQSLDAVVLLAEDGTIIEVNDRVQEYYGRTPDELRGQPVIELRYPSCRAVLAEDYRRVAESGGAVFERIHQRRDGSPFPVEVSARAIIHDEQRYFQSVVRDISKRKSTEAAFAAQSLCFQAIFEQAAVGMAQVAPDGRWLRVNDRLCAMVGYSRQELLQQPFQAITHPEDVQKDIWLTEQMLSDQIHTYSLEKRYIHRTGAILWVNLTLSLLRNAAGQPEYFIVVIDDISRRKQIEQRLARISRFYAALNATNEAILRNSGGADQLFETICRIAVHCGEIKGAWVGLRDPTTQQLQVRAAFGELRGRLVSQGEPVAEGAALPYRPARAVLDSGKHWLDNDLLSSRDPADWQILVATTGVRSCAAFPLNQAGKVIGAFSLYASEPEFFDPELIELLDQMAADVSFALDIFDSEDWRRQAEQGLRLAAAVYEQSAEGILVSDRNNAIIMVNRAFTQVTGYGLAEIQGQNPRKLASGRHDRAFYQAMWGSLQATGRWQGEIWNRRRNGEIYPEWLGITALHDATGQVSHYIGIFNDISAKRVAINQPATRASQDPLTGLPNPVLVRDRLQQALRQAPQQPCAVAVLWLDLDHFQTINQAYGYRIGDQLLQSIGHQLASLVGNADTVGRYGEDAFVIVLTDLKTCEEADRLAENILLALNDVWTVAGQHLTISASIGISLFPAHGQEAELLLERAALAMRHAKVSAPGRFFVYDDMLTATPSDPSTHTPPIS